MAEEADIAARVEKLLAAPIAGLGFRLLDVQFRHEGRWVLRLMIDGGRGVTLDDCGAVSEVAGRVLDVEDPIPHHFSLEVTSPGLFRVLKERKHFAQCVGKVCRFTLAPGALPERTERTLRGTIEAVGDDALTVAVEGAAVSVPLAAIRAARLDPDL